MNKINIIFIDSKYESELLEEMKKIEDEFYLIMNGRSISRQNVFNIFGVEYSRSIVITQVEGEKEKKIFKFVKEKFDTDKTGMYISLYGGDEKMVEYELVLAIAPEGYAQKVMDAGRTCGATGGTSVPARGSGAYFSKFLGMPIDKEKEIIMIVAKKSESQAICKGIGDILFQDDKRVGIVFSLPLANAVFPNEK